MTGWPSGYVHTPYAGAYKPFTIGMNLLDPREWIEADAHLPVYLDEKDRLLAADRDAVFREEPGTRPAQAEILDMLADYLPARFPEIYRRDGRFIAIAGGRRVDVEDDAEPPLVRAARLVQEDLVLMHKGEGGYRLAAGAVCFPSSWAFGSKFGKTLDGIHTPVPGYADFLAGRVNRIFDNLPVDRPVWRMSWSFHAEDALHHPHGNRWGDDAIAPFIRLERQTLRRLPVSGDILFTIRVHLDPVETLKSHPAGPSLAAGMKAELEGLSAPQLDYRSLSAARERLIGFLDGVIGC